MTCKTCGHDKKEHFEGRKGVADGWLGCTYRPKTCLWCKEKPDRKDYRYCTCVCECGKYEGVD